MYRMIHPGDRHQLSLRMLFHPVGEGVYRRACEANSFRGLVAALLDDPAYETARPQARLVERLRMADDIRLVAEVDGSKVFATDHDAPNSINIQSDESFIRSLHLLAIVSIAPSIPPAQQR